uniref:Alpha-1,3-glucosyltransferase n=1 Tax=Acrobeloides nanus TaxID=290746 RepID=A0A914DQ28_9BILA
MELYHALPIFVFLLSRSIVHIKGQFFVNVLQSLKNVLQLGIVVIGIFFIVWLPFLTDLDVAKQVLIRIFPLDRGIFEDKVANFWCSISVLIKIKEIYDKNFLAKLSALLVLTTNLPSLYVLFRRSSEKNLRICLVISSLAFYLFSFQVHEKSILLCTIPALFILNEFPNAILSFLSTSIFSMYHLCIKDGMPEILPLFILYTLFLWSLDSNKLWKFYHMANLVISLLICGLFFS